MDAEQIILLVLRTVRKNQRNTNRERRRRKRQGNNWYMKLEMKREIPTLIKVPGQNDKLLVTVKGRASTCLICGRPGARDTPGVTPNVRRQNKPATEHTVYSRHPQARRQRPKLYAHTNGPRQSQDSLPRGQKTRQTDQKKLRLTSAPASHAGQPPLTLTTTTCQDGLTTRPQEEQSTRPPRGSVA